MSKIIKLQGGWKTGKKSNALIKNTGLFQVLPKIYKEWPPHVQAKNLRHWCGDTFFKFKLI
jgi:hypothetical protein